MATSARRQLFRRSKAGCWNCRSKKKKCDELRPHCTRCIRAGGNCRYPDVSTESLSESNTSMLVNDCASPSKTSSASFPTSLSSMHAAPMLSRSSSTSGYSSQPHHPRHGPSSHHPYHHHPYASPSGPGPSHALPPQHRDYHAQQPSGYQRHSPPAPVQNGSHHPYHHGPHSNAHAQLPQQQFPPPPLSASAAADWDHTSQQHVFKRTRYDEFSSSASSTSSNPAYQDARARQPFDAHHRIPSNQSQTSSRGKARVTLPSISPHQPNSVAIAASASLPPIHTVSPPQHRPTASPDLSTRSANTSLDNHTSPVFANGRHQGPVTTASAESVAPDSRVYPPSHDAANVNSLPPLARVSDLQSHASPSPSSRQTSSSGAALPRQKLVLDYSSAELDPEQLMDGLPSLSLSIVTEQTKGANSYFNLLQGIACMSQGQAMAHALAAMIATQRANLSSANTSKKTATGSPQDGVVAAKDGSSSKNADDEATDLLELANRHHLASIKALQTQGQPSRRRRFSVIESSSSTPTAELPIGSNAAVMMLLILACSSVGKSLMLSSYLNQCEQYLADAVEHVSSHRLFPSVTGEPTDGTPEEPPMFVPENLSNYGTLLLLGTVVGLYECYLSQYTAITDWDYNPARLRRLLPFNWNESDAAIFDQTRNTVSETTYSVSMVTFELVIETLDTMRKFKQAEAIAYGDRKSSRREAEDGSAALDSLAHREELGLIIRDLEAGAFWKGAIAILSETEQLQVLDSIDGKFSQDKDEDKSSRQMPPPPALTNGDTSSTAILTAYRLGSLFVTPQTGSEADIKQQQVNRLRLGNHLYRNALLVDLYVTVFNRPASSQNIRDLVSRSISLLAAVPDKLESGLMWPAVVLGSYAQNVSERNQVRQFVHRAQWKGTSGPASAADVLERVWSEDAESWRESVTYFGSPYIS
ncbi:hypothetical protein NDA13_002569 [Ustilago tritici]|nr:hypothetical protein NDA13_002569 [Ustilago tritici]